MLRSSHYDINALGESFRPGDAGAVAAEAAEALEQELQGLRLGGGIGGRGRRSTAGGGTAAL